MKVRSWIVNCFYNRILKANIVPSQPPSPLVHVATVPLHGWSPAQLKLGPPSPGPRCLANTMQFFTGGSHPSWWNPAACGGAGAPGRYAALLVRRGRGRGAVGWSWQAGRRGRSMFCFLSQTRSKIGPGPLPYQTYR